MIVHGRRPQAAEQVATNLVADGGHASAATADLTDDAAVERLAADIDASLGGVDILVNNAGAYEPQLVERHRRRLAQPLRRQRCLGRPPVRLLVPAMRERGFGRVIQIFER